MSKLWSENVKMSCILRLKLFRGECNTEELMFVEGLNFGWKSNLLRWGVQPLPRKFSCKLLTLTSLAFPSKAFICAPWTEKIDFLILLIHSIQSRAQVEHFTLSCVMKWRETQHSRYAQKLNKTVFIVIAMIVQFCCSFHRMLQLYNMRASYMMFAFNDYYHAPLPSRSENKQTRRWQFWLRSQHKVFLLRLLEMSHFRWLENLLPDVFAFARTERLREEPIDENV